MSLFSHHGRLLVWVCPISTQLVSVAEHSVGFPRGLNMVCQPPPETGTWHVHNDEKDVHNARALSQKGTCIMHLHSLMRYAKAAAQETKWDPDFALHHSSKILAPSCWHFGSIFTFWPRLTCPLSRSVLMTRYTVDRRILSGVTWRKTWALVKFGFFSTTLATMSLAGCLLKGSLTTDLNT